MRLLLGTSETREVLRCKFTSTLHYYDENAIYRDLIHPNLTRDLIYLPHCPQIIKIYFSSRRTRW